MKRATGKLDDGLVFNPTTASAGTIREEDDYSGVRVTLGGTLSRATIRLHIDVNVGDPIWPEPQQVALPRLLNGTLQVRGYALEMVLAEKIVTAIARGTVNTRWRDFVDVYTLVRRHSIAAETLRESIVRVAQFRNIELNPLSTVLTGYADIAQRRWLSWLEKQKIDSTVPKEFSAVLDTAILFADPMVTSRVTTGTWSPTDQRWA